MAESSRVGSYKCEFIDDVPEHLICGLCKHAANGPSITTCCGELFCQACIASALEEKQPCPSCKKPTFSTFFNLKFEKSIKNLRVHCMMKDRGCHWTGQLEQLDAHLEVETGDCEYVDIECPEKCGQQVQKRQLAAHIANECPERDFVCQYCGFKATYAIISNKHWPECQNYPVPCPNECNIGAVERNILEDHLNTCPLQVVECDFSYAGCNKKLQRQDMEKHVEESTREHLALMAAASVRMSREFEKKLQEQRDEFREYLKQKEKETAVQLEHKDRQIEHLQESFQEQHVKVQGELHTQQQQVEALKDQIMQWEEKERKNTAKFTDLQQQLRLKTQQVEDLEKEVKLLIPVCGSLFPRSFIISQFQMKKKCNSFCRSPDMYTHSCGYKFFINVAPAGWGEGQNTHVAVWLWSMPGEFDDQLFWPAKFTITVQLLNQLGNFGHVKVTKRFEWNRLYPAFPESHSIRRKPVDSFSNTFSAHTELGENVRNRTWYLKKDCLHFKVMEVRPC